MKVLREFKEPTSIVIADAWIEDESNPELEEYCFKIDDDECGFDVTNGDKTEGVESFGFVYILTKDEFLKHINSDHYEQYDGEHSDWNRYVVINDFVGEVKLKVTIRGGEEVPSDKIDFDEYIQHQFDSWSDIEVVIPSEYDFEVSNEEKALKLLESGKGSKISDILSEKTKDQLFGEIDNQGFGYWLQHYGYKGEEDDELVVLCVKARRLMNKVEKRLRDLGVEI